MSWSPHATEDAPGSCLKLRLQGQIWYQHRRHIPPALKQTPDLLRAKSKIGTHLTGVTAALSCPPVRPASQIVFIVSDSAVVIEVKLMRMRTQPEWVNFVLYLIVDPSGDHIICENVSLSQKSVVLLKATSASSREPGVCPYCASSSRLMS